MYYFTSDEHYGHEKIIEYCDRPFDSVWDMDDEIIRRHNLLVTGRDIVIHIGDFAWGKQRPNRIINLLKGKHIFIKGSHDKWMPRETPATIWEKKIGVQYVAACHYPMRSWPRSHYASFHVFGHVHGKVYDDTTGVVAGYATGGLSYDVGVDANDFYPVDFDTLNRIMVEKAECLLDAPVGTMLDCYKLALEKLVGHQQDGL